MASINKLSVRGIRAFSPEDEEQLITFCFPLTIIVGANGCGKTTIIEALKFAVTGSLPPGNKSGQAFVHDPKHMRSTTVKGQVKLRFTNRAGKTMVVVRSMELTQKKSTMTFKTLDGILRTTDDQGNKQSLSHKCTELDRQIPQLLGVSKSVLDNVVFCHQEDSSWPLMEGAVLKKRFDDIFDSTRYVKALEEIKDQKKIYNNKVKELKAELNLLKGHKHAAQGFRNELDDCKHQLSLIMDEMKDYEVKVNEERDTMKQLQEEVRKVDDLQASIEDIGIKIDNETVRIETQKNGLQTDFTGSKTRQELENVLKGFGKSMESDAKDLKVANDRMNAIQGRIASLKQKQMDLLSEKGKLEGEKSIHDSNLQNRIDLMEELANKYGLELTFSQTQQTDGMNTQGSLITDDDGISLFTSNTHGSAASIHITDEDLEAFERSVVAKRSRLEEQLKEHIDMSRIGEDNIQNDLSELNGKIKSIENDLKRIAVEREKAKKEHQKISRITTSAQVRESDIQDARNQVKKFTNIRNEKMNDPRRVEIPLEIKQNEEKMKNLKSDVDGLNVVLKQLRKVAEEQNYINMLERQVVTDKAMMQDMINENSFTLQSKKIDIRLDDPGLTDNMRTIVNELSDKLDKSKQDSERYSDNLKDAENRVSALSGVLSQKKMTLEKKTDQLAVLSADGGGVQKMKHIIKAARQFETNTFDETTLTADVEPQQLLQHFADKMGELANDSDQPETISRTIKKLKKLSKKKNAAGETVDIICPCCTRSLGADEAIIFQSQIQKLADLSESPIIQMDREKAQINAMATRNYSIWRNAVSASINNWLDHKRISTEIDTLKESIREDEETLGKLQEEERVLKTKVDEERDDKTSLQEAFDIVRRLSEEATKLASKKYQIKNKKEELNLEAPDIGGKDLTKVEHELQTKTEEKEKLMNAISSLHNELSQLNDAVNAATIKCTQAERIVRSKEEQFAQEQESSARKRELNAALKKYQEDEQKLEEQLYPLREKASIKSTEREKFRMESKNEETKRMEILSNFNNHYEKIQSLSNQIEQFSKSNKLNLLLSLESEISSIIDEVKRCEDELSTLSPQVEEMKKKVQDKEAHQDNIRRNLELLDMIAAQQRLEDEQDLLQEKFDKLKYKETIELLNSTKKKIEKYKSEFDRRVGSKDALMVQQRELKRKLQTSEYKDIDERHRIKMIEHETSSMCVSDLDLYYTALDKALLRYHGIKIEEINKIIKELWALTYRGEDITNIRLTSDQDTSSRAARSYNYRVVMTKGTTELDMRGRCSAGQRVLASLVIRLALAETFCINCGVMALDEPTTNLDYANKRGLATALAQIIAHRAAQDNFQLIIITHDEEFVSMMKQELSSQTGFDMPERYFQVSREESHDGCYYSKITAVDWDEI